MKSLLLAVCAALILLAGCATSGSRPEPTPNPRAVEVLQRLDPSAGERPVRLRAVGMGADSGTTRWGSGLTNRGAIDTLPEGYFAYLKGVNVNWVGIQVAIHEPDSADPTVVRLYTGDARKMTISFTDEQLIAAIRAFKSHGFNVYLALAFEPITNAVHPVDRGTLGDPNAPRQHREIDPKFWPWSLTHPQHDSFVERFWASYTAQAVAIGRLAEAEGVRLYSLGTETDLLFRSRSGGNWPNAYGDQLRAMVKAVREVYSGLLSYDMLSPIIQAPNDFYGPGSDYLFHDMGLDVIGVSAYFSLYDSSRAGWVPSVDDLEKRWQHIFDAYLRPLQARNDGLPILFTECGYVDSTNAVVDANADLLAERVLIDANQNGLDDGEETQAHIYQALFNVMDRNPTVVYGAFLWGMMMADDVMYRLGANTGAMVREHGFRQKLAEKVVRDTYQRWQLQE